MKNQMESFGNPEAYVRAQDRPGMLRRLLDNASVALHALQNPSGPVLSIDGSPPLIGAEGNVIEAFAYHAAIELYVDEKVRPFARVRTSAVERTIAQYPYLNDDNDNAERDIMRMYAGIDRAYARMTPLQTRN